MIVTPIIGEAHRYHVLADSYQCLDCGHIHRSLPWPFTGQSCLACGVGRLERRTHLVDLDHDGKPHCSCEQQEFRGAVKGRTWTPCKHLIFIRSELARCGPKAPAPLTAQSDPLCAGTPGQTSPCVVTRKRQDSRAEAFTVNISGDCRE